MIKEPMLAESLLPPDVEHTDEVVMNAMKQLKYPVMATVKLDGIRAIKTDNLFSRSLKLIPNESIRVRAMKLPFGFDMELWTPDLRYDEIQSIVMSFEHPDSDKIQFHILDNFNLTCGYFDRMNQLHHSENYKWIAEEVDIDCQWPVTCHSALQLFAFEQMIIQEKGEGICLRTTNSPYKQGRSTLNEQYLVKLSRYVRSEVTIIGFEEQMLNGNSAKRNAIGKMDRSSQKHKMIGKGVLGAFIVQDENGLQFTVGTGVGLTDKLRSHVWNNIDDYMSRRMTIKHKPHGAKLKPRSPIMVGFRQEGY